MEHVVFHPVTDGMPGFHRFSSLEEAVRFVEHLRNAEGVEDVNVFALSPVPLAFRAYYKVEMPVGDAVPVAEVPAQPVAEVVEEPAADAPFEAEVEPAIASANGKRSLGFFAH
jgi:hypothetical protein